MSSLAWTIIAAPLLPTASLPAQLHSGAIAAVTRGPADLVVPGDSSEAQVLRYGLGFPFQVAPGLAGLWVNLRVELRPVGDFENGTDVVLFDSLDDISAEGAIPVSRNEWERDPETGTRRIVLKYPVSGGFVPLGARRQDGSPHPHAGTGFGVCQAISFPTDENGLYSWATERVHGTEVHQFSYDGERFAAERSASGAGGAHPQVGETEWRIIHPGITNAIPDGDDMLLAANVTPGKGAICGVTRWRRADGLWRPVGLSPVTPITEAWTEPSVVRDTDGALLFSARAYGPHINRIRVWRSQDVGETWELVIDLPDTRHEAPISLNQAADGTPYIAANLLGRQRETLCLWPLNAERAGLADPLVVRDAREEFGEPPGGSTWMVDHPSGAVLQLADGKWHGVLAYRILELAEHRGAAPPEQSGCYVEEVIFAGPPVPPWRFE
jgi:hypothetical protein